MTQRQSFAVLGFHAAVALGALIAVTVLGALHDLDGQAVVAIFGAVIGLAGGSAASFQAIATNGGPKADLTKVAESQVKAGQPVTVAGPQPGAPLEPPAL